MKEQKTLSKTEIQKQLFNEYGLYWDATNPNSKDNDVFKHKHYTLITRSGIEKIQKAANILIKYEVIYVNDQTIFLKATGSKLDKSGKVIDSIETFASASSDTSQSAYYPEMAEKRAMSRVVLKLAGLYEYGVFGSDETDEWKDAEKTRRSSSGAVYKEEE